MLRLSLGASQWARPRAAPVGCLCQSKLFTANAGSDSISSYAINADGSLTFASTTALRGGPGLGTFDQQLDPSGRYLYQLDGNLHLVSVLAVNGGSLTELSSSPVALPAGGAPFGLTVI
jgi:hypothetical protein